MDDLQGLVKDFLVESHENLDRLDDELVKLEHEPESPERLASIFRTIHTIKGTSGFFGFGTLQSVTHAGESLLSRLRDGELRLQPDMTTALLALVDAVRDMLAHIEEKGSEGEEKYEALVVRLTELQQARNAASEAKKREEASAADSQDAAAEAAMCWSTSSARDCASADLIEGGSAGAEAAAAERAALETEAGEATGPQVADAQMGDSKPPAESHRKMRSEAAEPDAAATGTAALPDARPAGVPATAEAHSDLEADPEAATAALPPSVEEPLAESASPNRISRLIPAADRTIRVDVALLDQLMNRVGELVLARNQILQFSAQSNDPALVSTTQRLNLITSELQEGVMKTRMQPIGNVWSRFPRLVRDLSLQLKKQIRLEMTGKETELDKTIVEAIKDPLTHIVRNAIDHGLETPEQREARNKPVEGSLILRAFHEGGQVIIEIKDDGAGLNTERIRKKAVDRGIISVEQSLRISDREAAQLIFEPGFSTAETVTNVSGRGVGMDVVKNNIEKIGGSVEIQTTPGKGTTIRIKIPLTLAIIPALIVTLNDDRFAIPQVSLSELVRLEPNAGKGIEFLQGTPVYRLRNRLLPIVDLGTQLELPSALECCRKEGRAINIVVLRADDREFGLVVDAINDTEEIVVKPLSRMLKSLPIYAGATIMGDGDVALILDVLGLAQKSKILLEHRHGAACPSVEDSSDDDQSQGSLLIVSLGSRRYALPLQSVARLEELRSGTVEFAGMQEVVQYRGSILPILRLDAVLGVPTFLAPEDRDRVPMVVVQAAGKSIGILVEQINDIVSVPAETIDASQRDVTTASTVIHDRVTDILNLTQLAGYVSAC